MNKHHPEDREISYPRVFLALRQLGLGYSLDSPRDCPGERQQRVGNEALPLDVVITPSEGVVLLGEDDDGWHAIELPGEPRAVRFPDSWGIVSIRRSAVWLPLPSLRSRLMGRPYPITETMILCAARPRRGIWIATDNMDQRDYAALLGD